MDETDLRQQLIEELKPLVLNSLPLDELDNEQLQEQIHSYVFQQLRVRMIPMDTMVYVASQIYASIRGYGILDGIMSDDSITEVMINGADNIFIEKNGKLQKLNDKFESQKKLEDIIQRIVAKAGREVNQANPIVDTRLLDGSRVNIVLPPIALCGPTVTIRKFSKTPMTVEKLIEYKSITREIAGKLELLVRAKYNIFICGGTGSGKTTFLNALSNYIPRDERVITIEDSAELQNPQ